MSLAARIQAGATGPAAGGAARRARADAAPLPAVVSVLDARRLDRDPRRRPLRDAVHPHRRPRRVGAGDHAGRRVGVAAAARLGRRRVARPDADRVGGHARADHRGVGARPPRARCTAPRRRALRRVRRPASQAVRALSQSGLYPTNCRLIDAREAALTGAGDGSHALLVLGFESAEHDVERWMTTRARDAARDHGGTLRAPRPRGDGGGGGVGSWREAFLRAPYLRDTFIAIGVLSETFETAITWERFPAFHERVLARDAPRRSARCAAHGIGDLPLHPRVSGRPGALLHDPRAGAARRRARAVGADQARRRRTR